jgi:FlaA1/EpsC-like NDP-sugar epimerase
MSWYAASGIDYSVVGAVLALIWLSLLALVDSRSRRILGHSAEEYRRIIDATLVLFGVIAFLSVVLELDLAGGHLAIALPLGLVGLLVNRRMWRGVAARKRTKGEYQTSLLVVGSSSAAAEVAAKLVRARELGFYVVGLCAPEGPTSQAEPVLLASRDVPVVGVDTAVKDAVKRTGGDTVAMSPTDHLTPVAIRRLIWDLEALGVDPIVTAGLIDVAAEAISSQPVAAGPGHHRPDRSGCAARPRGVLTWPCRPNSYGGTSARAPLLTRNRQNLCVDISGKMVHEGWSWRD